jgi:hypothetical protein
MFIKKFESFKLEYSNISEAIINYIESFSDILMMIKDDPIADELKKLNGGEIKPDMAFVKPSEKSGYIDFLRTRKANKLWKEFKGGDSIPDGLNSNDIDSFYNNKIRYEKFEPVKIGRFITTIFGDKFNNDQISSFINKFKALEGDFKDDPFELITGEDIDYWYKGSNYMPGGELNKSCMRYVYKNYFDIYIQNPDQCRLLILKSVDNPDKIVGRALVWKLEKTRGGYEYGIDRIYAINDVYREKFVNYASRAGWIDVYGASGHFTVSLDNWNFDTYPYMDTFSRLDPSEGTLHNDDNDTSDYAGDYILRSQDGDFRVVVAGEWSNYYEEIIPEGEYVWSEPLGDYIWDHLSIEVTVGSRRYWGYYPENHRKLTQIWNDEWAHEDDVIFSEYIQAYLLDDDAHDIITEFESDGTPLIEERSVPRDYKDCIEIDSRWNWVKKLSEINSKWDDNVEFIDSSLMSKINRGNKETWIPDVLVRISFKVIGEDKYLIEEDSKILGISIDKDITNLMDIFEYNDYYIKNFGSLRELIKIGKDKKSELENIISGKIGTIDFGDGDKEFYLKNIKRSISLIRVRIAELEEEWFYNI